MSDERSKPNDQTELNFMTFNSINYIATIVCMPLKPLKRKQNAFAVFFQQVSSQSIASPSSEPFFLFRKLAANEPKKSFFFLLRFRLDESRLNIFFISARTYLSAYNIFREHSLCFVGQTKRQPIWKRENYLPKIPIVVRFVECSEENETRGKLKNVAHRPIGSLVCRVLCVCPKCA